jgi:hypothetical protein
MRDVQSPSDRQENRVDAAGNDRREQLVFTQYPPGPIVFIGGQDESPEA